MTAGEAMDEAADKVFTSAQEKVPRVTGALADSGKVTRDDSGALLRRIVSYGSSERNPRTHRPTSSYAVYKHEIPVAGHMQGYKWLERALREYGKDSYVRDLASNLRGNF